MEELSLGQNIMVHLGKYSSELGPIELPRFREDCLVYMVKLYEWKSGVGLTTKTTHWKHCRFCIQKLSLVESTIAFCL